MDKSRKRGIEQAFFKQYGQLPTIWVQAPGRVDLMGSHTDYNEGFVLTEAIERNTWIALNPRTDGLVRIRSLNLDGCSEFALESIHYDKQIPWSNYVRGVAHVLQGEGFQLLGFDGLVHSTIPFGSGLSSSAALEMAVANAFVVLGNLEIDPVEIAKLCQRAENEFVGMNCGILDQYSSAMGEAGCILLLDCRDITSQIKPMASGIGVMICDTKAKRELTGSEYPERRAQCEEGVQILAQYYPEIKALRDVSLDQLEAQRKNLSAVVAKRCQFIVQENQRVLDIADALARGERQQIKELCVASFEGARDLYEISCVEMEKMHIAMMAAPGVIGARQAGAGFGGCLVAIIEADLAAEFSAYVSDQYFEATGIKADIFPAKASPGAGVLVSKD